MAAQEFVGLSKKGKLGCPSQPQTIQNPGEVYFKKSCIKKVRHEQYPNVLQTLNPPPAISEPSFPPITSCEQSKLIKHA